MIPMVTRRKLMPEHWTFASMESRAITAFNTGHLVFRGTKQYMFNGKLGGTKTFLFDQCHYTDSLYYMMWNCEWYEREGITPKDKWREEGMSISKDLAEYLIDLHELGIRRIRRWGVTLITVDGWL